jgi:hypothetical protein
MIDVRSDIVVVVVVVVVIVVVGVGKKMGTM